MHCVTHPDRFALLSYAGSFAMRLVRDGNKNSALKKKHILTVVKHNL